MKSLSAKDEKVVSISQAAEILGVSIDTIRRWDKEGTLHSTRDKNNVRFFSVSELEKIKFAKPLSISDAASHLGISQSTLRRLEKKGEITPTRNESGERVYDKKSLEKFLNSEYFLRQKEVEEKILEPLNHTPGEEEKKSVNANEADIADQAVIGTVVTEHHQEIANLLNFKKMFYGAGALLTTAFILLVAIITILFLLFPQDTAKFFGLGRSKILANQSSSGLVLGAKYPSDVMGVKTEATTLGKALKPFGNVALGVVGQVSPETYEKIVPKKPIEDINDIFTIDENNNVSSYYNLTFPDSSYLVIPDKGLIKNLNAEFVQGRVPGTNEGNLVIYGKDGKITGLKVAKADITGFSVGTSDVVDGSITSLDLSDGSVTSSELLDGTIVTVDLSDGSVATAKLADSAVTSGKIADGTIVNSDISDSAAIKDSKLAQITAGDKVAGSAVQLNSTGGLVNSSGLSLTRTCGNGQVLSWNGSAWACSDQSTGTGDITSVIAGDGLTGGATSGDATLNIGAGAGITVTSDTIAATLGTSVDLTSEVTGTLPVANGGTNAATIGSAGSIAYSTGTAYAFSSAGTTGQCLVSGGTGTPTWGTCGGTGVTSLDGLTGALTLANSSGSGSTVTIDNAAADGITKGIAAFNSTNFTASSGVVNTVQNIHTAAAPTFAGITFTNTSNQLVLGTTNTTTISSAAPTVSRVATIPALSANDTFVFENQAQVLTNKTISGSSNTISNIGNSSLTNSSITFAGDTGSSATSLGATRTITGGTGLTSVDNGSGTLSLSVGAGDGITAGADSISVDTTTTGTTLITASNSGLETTSGGVRLLGGCSANQILKWNSGSSAWVCSTDTGGLAVEENDVTVSANATSLDLLGTDFNVTELPSGEANIAIDYANSGITRSAQAESITGAWTLRDSVVSFVDNADATKALKFELSSITAGTTRTLTAPDVNGTLITTGNLSAITTVGTITSGTWNGSTIAVPYGGTGATSFTSNGLLYGNGTGAIQNTAAGTSGQILQANGAGVPTFATLSGDATIAAGGALTLSTVNSNVGTFGSATQVPQVTVDGKGRITGVTNVTISGTTPGGAAGGDLSGTYPNPSVSKINGATLGTTTATTGNVLIGDGTSWVTRSLSGDITVSSTGVTTIGVNTVALETDTTGSFVEDLTSGSGVTVTGGTGESSNPSLALGPLTANWNQTGAFDITLNNAGSELRLLESAGDTFLGTLDVGDLAADATYTFSGTSGTVLTSANYTGALDSAYVNVGESPAAGDITGSFSGGLNIGANTVALGTDTTGDYVASFTAGGGLTGDAAGEGSTPTLAIGAGNGVTVNANDVTLNVQANKGLEVDSNGLSFIDCATDQILKYNGSNQWACAADSNSSSTTFADNVFRIQDSADTTKQIAFEASGILTGTTRTFTAPNVNGTLITSGNLSDITAVGTVTSGTWNGSTIAVPYGGTGATSFTSNGLVYGNGTGALQVTAAGTSGQLLVANASGVPTFVTVSGDATLAASGALTIAADAVALGTDTTGSYVSTITSGNGISSTATGEGSTPTVALSALTADWNQTGAFDIVLNNAASELRILESAGATFFGTFDVTDLTADRTYTFPNATGEVSVLGQTISNAELENSTVSYGGVTLSLGGTDATPAFNLVDATGLPIDAGTTGTLPIARGGTNGTATPTAGGVAYGSGTAYAFTTAGTSGQCLTSAGAGTPTWGTCGSGDITSVGDVTNGAAFDGTQGNVLQFEGAAADEFEITLTGADPGADFTITLPALTGTVALLEGTQTFSGAKTFSATTTFDGAIAANGNVTLGNATTDRLTVTSQLLGASPLVFQGATDDAFTTTLAFTDPATSSKTITFPNATGTVAVSATGPIALSALGDITCATCLTSTGGGTFALTLSGSAGTPQTINAGDTISIAAGTGITTTAGATDTVTVAATLGTSVDLASEVTGILPLANGGTNANLSAVNGGIVYSGASSLAVSVAGTSGQCLTSGGAGAPTWAACGGAGDISSVGDVTSGAAFDGTQGNALQFEGSAADDFETTLTAANPGADFVITLPGITGTVALLEGAQTFSGAKTFSDLTISDSIIPFTGGNTDLDVQGGATRTLSLYNSTTSQVADLDLSDGSLKTAGTTRLTNGGTLQNVTYNGTTVGTSYGGTNATTIGSAGSVAYSTGTAYAFSGAGTSGQCLKSDGTNSPIWQSCSTTSGITARESDGAPSINNTTTLEFGPSASDSQAEFILSDQTGGVSRVRIGTGVALLADNETVTGAYTFSGGLTCTDCIALGGETSGNFVQDITAGTGLTTPQSAGENTQYTLNIGAGNGITANADDIAVDVTTTGTVVGNTSSNSGLYASSDGLRLLGGCSDTQVLKWNSSSSVWECSTDQGSSQNTFLIMDADAGTNPQADASNDTLSIIGGSGIDTTGDSGADTLTWNLGDLTSNWTQGGAFDIVLNNASSHLSIRENGGGSDLATFDVASLTGNKTYTFSGDSGIVFTDQNYSTTLDSIYINAGESPAAGDITGSFSGGLLVGANTVALETDTTGSFVEDITAGGGLTGTVTGESSNPTLAVGAGSGITVNADDIAINLISEVDSSGLSSSQSGFEFGGTSGAQVGLIRGCTDGQVLKWADGTGEWGCGADSGAGASPFTAVSGIIDKTTAGDRLRLQYGDASDVQLQIENTTNNVVPTEDAMQILLSGGSGVNTDGVDGLYINFEAGGAASKTVSALHLDFDTVGSPTGTFDALQIDAIPGSTAQENAIQIGSGWDVVLDSQSVDITGAGDVSGVDDLQVNGLVDLFNNAYDDAASGCPGLGNSGKLTVNSSGRIICAADVSAGTPTWNSISAPTGNLSLNHAQNTTVFNWDTDSGATAGFDGMTFGINNDISGFTQRAVVIKNNDVAGGGATERLLVLDNADTDGSAVTTALEVLATGTVTTAIDVSAANIGTALNFGANDIDGTSFDVTGATGNITTAGDLAVNGDDITSDGTLTIDSSGITQLSSGDTFQVQGTGNVLVGTGRLDVASAGNLNIGTTTATSVTIGTGSGDGSVVLPTDSIGTTEILNNTITGTDISDDNLDFTDFADSMTIDAATTITSTLNNATALDLAVTPSAATGTVIGLEISPTLPGGASATTLTGLHINPVGSATSGNTIRGLHVANLTGAAAGNTETAFEIGTGWDTGLLVGSGGVTISAGALAVNSDSITSDGTLTLDSSGTVQLASGDTFQVQGAGNILLGTGRLDVASAGQLSLGTTTATSIVLGSSSNGSFTVTTNGTGDSEVFLPDDSIGANEIADNVVNGTHIQDDSLDFTELADSMTLDTATTIAQGSNAFTINNNGTANTILNLSSTGDFVIQDASSTYVTFDDSGLTTFTNDVDLTFGAGENLSVGVSAAPTTDVLAISTSTGSTTTGVEALSVSFTQADDADATDTNAGVSVNLTSSSGDADTLYGINVADITGGSASETGLRIGTGFDTGIAIASGGLSITAGALAVNSDSITSDGTLTIDASDASAGTVRLGLGDSFEVRTSGNILLGTGRLDVSSAGVLNIGTTTATTIVLGSATNNSITLTTDGTGDGEVVLPTDSIGSSEILDGAVTTTDISNNSLDFADFANAMTLDTFTSISHSPSSAGTSLNIAVSPQGSVGAPIAFAVSPTAGIDAPDQTLIGFFVDASTNGNADSGDILYGINIDDITNNSSTANGEIALVIEGGWDTSIQTAGNVDFDGTITAGSSGIALTNSTGNIIAGAYGAASIDGDDIDSSIAGAGLTLTTGSPDTLDIELTSSDGTGVTSSGSGLEFSTIGTSGQLGLIQGCSDSQLLKWATGPKTWQCSNDITAGTPSLNQISAAIGEGVAQDSNENTVRWNWDFTGAAATDDTGLLISESSATTAGDQDKKSLFEIVTLSGSKASPFQITNASDDVGDIFFDLTGSADFELRDGGTAFAQFNDDSSILLGHASQTTGITIGQSTASNTISIGNANTATGNTQTINIGAGTPAGTGATAITIGNVTSSTALDLRAGTGDLELDAVGTGADILADAAGAISLDATGASSNFTVTGSGLNLSLGVAGGGAQELQLSSAGTGTAALNIDVTGVGGDADIDVNDAITIDSTSFSIDSTTASNITVTGAGQDLTLDSAGGSVLVRSTENAAQAIRLHANGGTSETIQIHSDQGTGVASLDLLSDVGGITLTATGLASNDAINLSASAGGVDIDAAASFDVDISGGQVLISSKDNAASAIALTTNVGTSETIVLTNTQGTNAAAINLAATAGGVTLTGGLASADAININTSNAAGGIDIDAGTGGIIADSTGLISFDTTNAGNSNFTTNATNADLTLEALGGGTNQVIINSAGTSASAVDINATGTVAGAAVTIDTTDGGITFTAGGAANGDITLSAGDDTFINSTADGGNVHITAGDGEAAAVGTAESIELRATADTIVGLTAGGSLVVDGRTTVSTNTDGALDINFTSLTNGAEAANIDVISTSALDNDEVAGLVINLDDDSTAATAALYGLSIASSDSTGSSGITGIYLDNTLESGAIVESDLEVWFGTPADIGGTGTISLTYDAATDAAFEMDGALVAIGDDPGGSLATGDGDLIVQDALEVDGASDFAGALAANGGITFDQATDTVGAHTLSGNIDANSNIITEIGSASTSFTTNGALAINIDGAETALLIDNGANAASLFVAEDNNAAVFTIADGGVVTATQNINANGGLDIDDVFTIADGGVVTTTANINANVGLDVDDVFVVADGGVVTSGEALTVNDDVDINLAAGEDLTITSITAAATVDLVTITNNGQGTTTTGVDGLSVTLGTTSDSAADTNSAIHATINNTARDASDVINGLEITGSANTVASSTQNLIFLDPAASGNTNGTLNGLNIDSITTPGAATEQAINIGNNWDTAINIGTGVTTALNAQSGDIITSNLGVNFTDSDTNPTCSAGDFKIYADTSENKLKKCQNGVISDINAIPDMVYASDTSDTTWADNDTTALWNGTLPSITPKSTDSEILVMVTVRATVNAGTNSGSNPMFRVDQEVGTADCADNNNIGATQGFTNTDGAAATNTAGGVHNATLIAVGAPATTSSTSYILCTSADSALTGTNTEHRIDMTLFEMNDSADLAEVYPTNDETIQSAEVVSMDPESDIAIVRTQKAYDRNLLGVITTRPAMVIGGTEGKGKTGKPVALSGRVPVKVITQNGKIRKGDLLTSSTTPGAAMRATKAGPILGIAMTDYEGEGVGSVMAFVKTGYFSGSNLSSVLGEISGQSVAKGDISKAALSHFMNNKEELIEEDLSEVLTDRLAAGLEIITPKVTTSELFVDTIQAASGSDVALQLGSDGRFVIKNDKDEEVVSFDDKGNAHFAGTITADKIKANQIEGLEYLIRETAHSASSRQAQNQTQNHAASTSAQPASELDSLASANSSKALDVDKLLAKSDPALAAELNGDSTDNENVLGTKTQEDVELSAFTSATQDGAISIDKPVEFKAKSIFSAIVEFFSNVIFNGDVLFRGRPTFNKDTAGFALIKEGAKKVRVTFEKEYASTPVVTASSIWDIDEAQLSELTQKEMYLLQKQDFVIAAVNTKGFTILLEQAAIVDLKFSWNALSVEGGNTSESTESAKESNLEVTNEVKEEAAKSLQKAKEESVTPTPTEEQKKKITIKENELGFLRVRKESNADSEEVGKVDLGQTFDVLEEENGWYKIEYADGKTGWVSGAYVNVND